MTNPAFPAESSRILGFPTMLLLAIACGLGVGNSYYAQQLIGPISQSLGLAPQLSGLIVSVMQLGYVVGLIFVVPLGDMVENRRLITSLLAAAGAKGGVTSGANVRSGTKGFGVSHGGRDQDLGAKVTTTYDGPACDHCAIVTFPGHVLLTIVVLILALAVCLLLLATGFANTRSQGRARRAHTRWVYARFGA